MINKDQITRIVSKIIDINDKISPGEPFTEAQLGKINLGVTMIAETVDLILPMVVEEVVKVQLAQRQG